VQGDVSVGDIVLVVFVVEDLLSLQKEAKPLQQITA